jgi:hypothetical protein
MSGKKAFVALAVATSFSMLAIVSAVAGSDRSDRVIPRGYVLPCNLVGVNPVYHPEIFGNLVWAREYGLRQWRWGHLLPLLAGLARPRRPLSKQP